MPATARVPAPAALGRLRLAVPRPRTAAEWVVLTTYVASVVVLWVFVARNSSRVPYLDEYANLGIVYGEGVTAGALWHQHNEHRIPLPKLVYVAAVRAAGYDFRAPLWVDAALLVGVTGFLLAVARRARGRTAVEDVFLPLTVLGLGGWENLIWAFQVQFILSTTMSVVLLGLVAVPGFGASTGRIALAGLLLALLPLCGANGLALVPAVGVGLGYVGLRNLRAADPALQRPGVAALLAAAVGVMVLLAYFTGLKPVPHHAAPKLAGPIAVSTVNFLGLAFGPVAHLLHTPGYDDPTLAGGVAVGLVALTGGLLLARLRSPDERPRAVMLGCLIGGWLCLAGGIAYGRAGLGNLMGASRYITLAMPVLVAVYLAWVALGGRVGRRAVPVALALLAVAAWVPNTRYAKLAAGFQAARGRRVEYQIRGGVPIGFVADGNRYVHPGGPADFRKAIEYMRDKGQRPFAAVQPDVPVRTEPVPLRVLRTEGVEEIAGGYRATAGTGTVVLALPAPRHAYGLALTYEAAPPPGSQVLSLVSWDKGGAAPPAPGYAVVDQLMATDGPLTTRMLVDREVDALRIDLAGAGATLKLHGLAVLSRAE